METNNRNIVFFDLETTGVNVARDRIVQIAILILRPDGTSNQSSVIVNPGIPIPKEASDIHGITDEMVKSCQPFTTYAKSIVTVMSGSVLAGYNILNFDIPLLAEEFLRCDLEMPLCPVVDAFSIFKAMERRDLTAALKFYCGEEMEGAHDALNDVIATRKVLFGQMERYPDLPKSVTDLADFCNNGKVVVDFAGKFSKDADGDYIYTLGKNKGQKVKYDTSFAKWMMGQDFTLDTKRWCQRIIQEITTGQTYI